VKPGALNFDPYVSVCIRLSFKPKLVFALFAFKFYWKPTHRNAFTMLLQLLLHYLRCLANGSQFASIPAGDSEVFRSRTPSELFNRAQRNRRLFTIFSDALTMMFQRMFPPVGLTRQRTIKAEFSAKTPRFFPVPFKSWITWERSLRFKYSATTNKPAQNAKAANVWTCRYRLLRARLLLEPEFSDP
jgi:hypothetical protein